MSATDAAPIATAEVLAVGAELLAGETRDSNSGDIAGSLTHLGVEVRRMTQLPDELDLIADAIRAALGRVDLVVTTGGLGPTPDDLTREGIAAAIGEEATVDPDLEAWLRELWAARGLPFSNVNLKQAWLVPSATALPNPNGTAPGWWVARGHQLIVALPGPPRELGPMWHDQVLPRLLERGLGVDRAVETLRLTGIGESAVVDLVGAELLAGEDPRLATYAGPDFVDLRVSATGDDRHTAREKVEAAIDALSPRIDPYVFGRNDDDWSVALGARLGARRLATAEVGTAGYLGLLLGTASFLVHAEQRRDADADPGALATEVRVRAGADIGLAVIARDRGDDLRVSVGIDLDGDVSETEHTVFRGGDIGRRRAANAGAASLWRRLADA